MSNFFAADASEQTGREEGVAGTRLLQMLGKTPFSFSEYVRPNLTQLQYRTNGRYRAN